MQDFNYLWFSLTLLAFSAGLVWLVPSQRRLMLLSAGLSAPYALASPLFVPAYWAPVRVIGGVTGIEDLVFSFANGAVVWLFAVWFVRRRIRVNIHPPRMLFQFALWAAAGVASGFLLGVAGAPVMYAVLGGAVFVGLLIIKLHPKFWQLSLAGAAGFTVYYAVVLGLFFRLFPDFSIQWNQAALSGFTQAGMPVEEILWALVYGLIWPLVMAMAFDLRIDSRGGGGEQTV